MPQTPVFLERQSYRLRRLIDAVRLLPFLGLAIFMIPLAWPQSGVDAGATTTSVALRYLFGGWIGLVVTGWLLWRRTRGQTTPQTDATGAQPH